MNLCKTQGEVLHQIGHEMREVQALFSKHQNPDWKQIIDHHPTKLTNFKW